MKKITIVVHRISPKSISASNAVLLSVGVVRSEAYCTGHGRRERRSFGRRSRPRPMSVPEEAVARRPGSEVGRWWEPLAPTASIGRRRVTSLRDRTPPPTASGSLHIGHVMSLHAHRSRGAVPTHARRRGLLPDGLGRQRPPHRAPRAELLRCSVRSVAPVRSGVRRLEPGSDPTTARSRSAVRTSSTSARGSPPRTRRRSRRCSGGWGSRSTGGRPTRRSARSPVARRTGVPSARASGLASRPRHLRCGTSTSDRGRPGRDRGSGGPGTYHRVAFDLGGRRRRVGGRDVTPGADPGLRVARGEPRRPSGTSLVGKTAPRPCSACRFPWSRTSSPTPRRNRRRADLHVRRRHRRRVVARARAAGPRGRATGRRARVAGSASPAGSRAIRSRRTPRWSARGQGRSRLANRSSSSSATAAGSSASRTGAARREVLREGRPARGGLEPSVVRADARVQGRAARARPRARLAPGVHGLAVRELGRGLNQDWAVSRQRYFGCRSQCGSRSTTGEPRYEQPILPRKPRSRSIHSTTCRPATRPTARRARGSWAIPT